MSKKEKRFRRETLQGYLDPVEFQVDNEILISKILGDPKYTLGPHGGLFWHKAICLPSRKTFDFPKNALLLWRAGINHRPSNGYRDKPESPEASNATAERY